MTDVASEPPVEPVLVLRTCDKDLKSYQGFQWPESGMVEAPDWNPAPVCGGGLHGLLWGEGDSDHLNWVAADAKWMVVAVDPAEMVDLNGKVKFPRGEVLHVGDRGSVTHFIRNRRGHGEETSRVHGGQATASGDGGQATASGYGGQATAGVDGIIVVRWWDQSAKRTRFAVGYIGEDGLKPGVPYRWAGGKWIEVEVAASPIV